MTILIFIIALAILVKLFQLERRLRVPTNEEVEQAITALENATGTEEGEVRTAIQTLKDEIARLSANQTITQEQLDRINAATERVANIFTPDAPPA